jgi:hypothetical protein
MFNTDLVAPADAQSSDADADYLSDCNGDGENCESVPRQWQLAIDVGVTF